MTRGGSSLSSSGIGGISIGLAPSGPPGSPLATTFIIQVPNENGDGPGLGEREKIAHGEPRFRASVTCCPTVFLRRCHPFQNG